jgi:hypothetical protein
MTRAEACQRFFISEEELIGWEVAFERAGIPGLRVTTRRHRPGRVWVHHRPTISSARACRGSGRSASAEPVLVTGLAANLQSADGSRTPPTDLPSYPSPASVWVFIVSSRLIRLLSREYFRSKPVFNMRKRRDVSYWHPSDETIGMEKV